MSILKKISKGLISALAVVGLISGCSLSTPTSLLPGLEEVTAATGAQIANDLKAELDAAKQLPREARVIHRASVEVTDVADDVVVEAAHLPAGEHFAGVEATAKVSY